MTKREMVSNRASVWGRRSVGVGAAGAGLVFGVSAALVGELLTAPLLLPVIGLELWVRGAVAVQSASEALAQRLETPDDGYDALEPEPKRGSRARPELVGVRLPPRPPSGGYQQRTRHRG